MSIRTKRALVLVGAGGSIEFGAPSTAALTASIESRVLNDDRTRRCHADLAYLEIRDALASYLRGGPKAVTFEQIYHCAHELLFAFEPIQGAVDEYRPILFPFLARRFSANERALDRLVQRMAEIVFVEVSRACDRPAASLVPLKEFIAGLRRNYITRIYTTNYDDFLLQAAPDLYTGFERGPSDNPRPFNPRAFWWAADNDSVFHLHGSVHLGFPRPTPLKPNIEGIYWFDDRDEALKYFSFTSKGKPGMDGRQIEDAQIVTGLGKLSHLQRAPFSHYYASMGRDAQMADIVYVIGSGLGDLHINEWLANARRVRPQPPLIFVDYWPDDFLRYTEFNLDRKSIKMIHDLRILAHAEYYKGERLGSGWTLAKDRGSAVWDKGFLAFLDAPDELDHVLGELRSDEE